MDGFLIQEVAIGFRREGKVMQPEDVWNFPAEVGQHFCWVIEMGFGVELQEATRVVFSGSGVSVTVYHGRSSREVGVEVLPRGGETPYAMSELMRLKDADEAAAYRNPIALTRRELDTALAQQSERLRRFGVECLRGDEDVIAQLAVNRARWMEAYELETRLSSAIPKADDAFREGNYRRVVELLAPLERGLSPVLRKKLEVARKKA